ncbi:MAG: Dihydrofolate reductase type 3 [Microgenomates bacterium OLB23]|nr:MAG: Dihydrofolate reductase type 3 [Microgenomates bacterium OLB23]
MNTPKIHIIAAHDKNRGIGRNNDLPWHLSQDLQHFKRTTLGKPVLMGRNTYDSILARIGKPLPHRLNIVITSQPLQINFSEVKTARSIDEAMAIAINLNAEELFVIGGAQLYKATLPIAEKLYITEIDGVFDCDTYFPEYKNMFRLVSQQEGIENNLHFTWNEYIRT